ncbi:MAG: hypothetical protein JO112_03080, partial [Planctomycetes bacterium]|nr:hypothetical protein [Planctomycetota bacterium]
ELIGNVTVVNNRRTPQPDDDLTLFTQGPVYYRADKNFIYTLEPVRLEDKQSKPKPMVVTATGMDVYLTADSNPPGQGPPAGHKNPNSSVSGVKSVSLRSLVEMDLYVDSRSGFLAAGKSDAKPAAPPPPEAKNPNPKAAPAVASKSHITIRTEGPFDYNVLQDYAEFHTSQSPSSLPKGVDVTREHEDGQWDHLLCDHLILQFHRKENPQAPAPTSATDSRNLDLEIENAHATADLGKEIFLSSNKEALDAFGKDLYYDARTHTTILKGETGPMFPLATSFRPMKAVKDLNVIYARELQMVEGPTGREATALGPGKIDLWDKKTKSYPLHAQWKDKLVSSKDGGFDCLTLTGEAVFQDEEHDQSLRGDSLKVWFTPNDQADTNHGDAAHGDPNATVAPQQRVKPQHVEARGHVLVNSPELHVQGPTERLVIWFKDTVVNAQLPGSTSPPGDKIPATSSSPPQPASPAGEPAPAGAPTQATASTTPAPAVPAENKKETPPAAPAAASPGTAPPEKPKKPMFLSARSIEAYVLRGPTKSDLDRLWCEGTVRVLQEGETPEDKGVDIRGETLQMHHYTEGNVLVVTGRLALVQMNQTSILGPEVTIDQKTNVAQVNGLGVMKLPASNDFGGRPLAHAAEITIVWRDSMLFDGKCAEFHGDIQAKQQNSRLLCQEMQVFLDRAISFKEGDRGRQPAKVQKLLCDKQVFVEDKTLQGTQLVNYKRLTTPVVSFDNEEGKVTAAGPGLVHILQPGSDEDPLLNPTTPNSGPKPAPARGKEKDKD